MRFTIDGKRYDTTKMVCVDDDQRETSAGVYRNGVYMTPKSKRVFVHTASQWDRGDGVAVGDRLHEADLDEIAVLAQELESDELYDLLPDDNE